MWKRLEQLNFSYGWCDKGGGMRRIAVLQVDKSMIRQGKLSLLD